MLLFNTEEDTSDQPTPPGEVTWVHLDPSKKDDLQKYLQKLNVHPLANAAMNSFTEIPRVDIYKNYAFVSSAAIKEDYSIARISILAGKNYVITYQEENDISLFSKLKEDFRDHPDHMSTPGHLLYHILDKVAMYYLKVVDNISDEIQELERRVFQTPFANEIGHQVYRWKVKLHDLRQVVEAQENVIKTIGRSDFPYINEDSGYYFQDLKDNFSRVVSAFDTFRETLSGIFDLQISLKSDHMNAIMKTLTLVSVVFIPMTFIAGMYGMNFESMPELKWRYGYVYALILMFGLGAGIAWYFRKKGWWGKPAKNK
ncbi:magnesium/cobalt transporter CorA [Ammoniphilus sp. YIM 78166]|uniref:magnesium/cobalt transporter CorA n=1 Tax=Ammoniphilus sp. YIM 78166 TaxID=1644106 RepID=UPI0014321AF1|nr:magnesium/cobalt transporter CorA [Ammoniphilus sp. YIM 78166]